MLNIQISFKDINMYFVEILTTVTTLYSFQIYTILSICLGTPPKTITWEYYDMRKNYKSIGPISPLEFYRERIKPNFDMEEKVIF